MFIPRIRHGSGKTQREKFTPKLVYIRKKTSAGKRKNKIVRESQLLNMPVLRLFYRRLFYMCIVSQQQI
jgi:hypothetical protein